MGGYSSGGEKRFYVYVITNKVNGKMYIGKTGGKHPYYRWTAHKRAARTGKCGVVDCSKWPIYLSMNKYGYDSFTFELMFEFESEQEALDTETYMIAALGTRVPNGMNITNGGEGVSGRPCSEKTKAAIRAANTSKITDDEVRSIRERSALGVSRKELAKEYGVTSTLIIRVVRGLARKDAGGPLSHENRNLPDMGHPFSWNQAFLLSGWGLRPSGVRVAMGRDDDSFPLADGTRRQLRTFGKNMLMAAAKTGATRAPHSKETIEKIAAANRGRKASVETRIKLSKSHIIHGKYATNPAEPKVKTGPHKWTAEEKKSISEKLMGHEVSDECRKRISDTLKSKLASGWRPNLSESGRIRIAESLQRNRTPDVNPTIRGLSELDVVAIRTEFSRGAAARDLAQEYAVSTTMIYRIAYGLAWSNIGGPISKKRSK